MSSQASEFRLKGTGCATLDETSAAALQSPSARRLAEICQQVPPRQWWKAFAESYPKPLKSAGRPSTEERSSTQARPGSSEPEEARRS